MAINYENLNTTEHIMANVDEHTYMVRIEAIMAEGHDVATAIENAVIDEHFDFVSACDKIERGQYDDIDGVFAEYDADEHDVYTDIDDSIFTADHIQTLSEKLYYALVNDYNSRMEYLVEGER